MISLKDRTCLITGGTRGIGKEIAILLEKEGCRVVAAGRKDGDVSTKEGIKQLTEKVEEEIMNADMLINCAGIYHRKPIHETTIEEFDYLFNVNVKATWLLTRHYVPHMILSQWGRIVNFGSIASYHGHSDQSLYNATKHAVLGLSRCLVKELNNHHIRVMCVSPAGTQTDMSKALIDTEDHKTFLDPKEIAEHVVFNLKFDNKLINTELRLNRLFMSESEKIM